MNEPLFFEMVFGGALVFILASLFLMFVSIFTGPRFDRWGKPVSRINMNPPPVPRGSLNLGGDIYGNLRPGPKPVINIKRKS